MRRSTENAPRRGPGRAGRHLPADPGPIRRLPPLLRRAWYGLNQAFRRRVAHLGLTPDQYTVLRTLAEVGGGGLTQRELTESMCSDPNTIASLLSRMAEAGLIERRPHERDGRAHRIALLPAGGQRLEVARRVAAALQDEVLAVLPDAEREGFLGQLDRVAEACQTAIERSPRNRPRKLSRP